MVDPAVEPRGAMQLPHGLSYKLFFALASELMFGGERH